MTTSHKGIKHDVKCNGAQSKIAYVRWAPSSADAQTITDAQGVSGVARTSEGLYVISFTSIPAVIIPLGATQVDNGTTLYVFPRVKTTSASAGTATVDLKTIAVASVASGPAVSDVIDELCFTFLLVGGNL